MTTSDWNSFGLEIPTMLVGKQKKKKKTKKKRLNEIIPWSIILTTRREGKQSVEASKNYRLKGFRRSSSTLNNNKQRWFTDDNRQTTSLDKSDSDKITSLKKQKVGNSEKLVIFILQIFVL